MKRFSIVLFFILPILTVCSSAVKKDPIFYSDNKKFIIPLCPNKGDLCVDPMVLDDQGLKPLPIEDKISNSLSDFGTVVGEIEVFYSSENAYQFYIIHDENVGILYLYKNNAQLRDHFLKKSLTVNYYEQKEVTEYFHIAGESDGVSADIDLYNVISNNYGVIFAIKLKNTSNIKKTINTTTDKITLFLKDAKTRKKIEIQLYLYNYCSKSQLSYINDIEPGEEREYFAIAKFKSENESVGIQVTLQLIKITIDGLMFAERDKSFQKSIDKIKSLWGGGLRIGDKIIMLEPKILITTITPR